MAHKLQIEKEEAIKKMVNKMVKQKKFTMEYVFKTVGEKFFLMPNTIEHIMYGQYDKRRNKEIKPKKHEKAQD